MGVGSYQSKHFTAYFYEGYIIIRTKYQTIRISPQPHSEVLINDLVLALAKNEIQTLADLRDYNGKLIWTNTSRLS